MLGKAQESRAGRYAHEICVDVENIAGKDGGRQLCWEPGLAPAITGRTWLDSHVTKLREKIAVRRRDRWMQTLFPVYIGRPLL